MKKGAGVTIEVQDVRDLSTRIRELSVELKDLRPMFEQFASDFYKQEKTLFQLSGPGQFEDLSGSLSPPSGYKAAKQKKYGRIYPILFASGRLAASLLSRNTSASICVIKPAYLMIGTAVPYGVYHQSMKTPRNKLPRRRMWDEESENGRQFERWYRIVDTYMQKALDKAFKNG